MMSFEMYTKAGTSPSGRICGGPAVKGRATWPGVAIGDAAWSGMARRTSPGTWMAFGHANALAARRGPLEIPI